MFQPTGQCLNGGVFFLAPHIAQHIFQQEAQYDRQAFQGITHTGFKIDYAVALLADIEDAKRRCSGIFHRFIIAFYRA
jgi:hypothetical protein